MIISRNIDLRVKQSCVPIRKPEEFSWVGFKLLPFLKNTDIERFGTSLVEQCSYINFFENKGENLTAAALSILCCKTIIHIKFDEEILNFLIENSLKKLDEFKNYNIK
jgi:hypothetical protein